MEEEKIGGGERKKEKGEWKCFTIFGFPKNVTIHSNNFPSASIFLADFLDCY